MTVLYHDYETYCELDIKEVGAYRYCEHPSLEILMMSWAIDDCPVNLWVPAEGEPMPTELFMAMCDYSVQLRAFNAQFERLVTRHALAKYLPELPAATRYRCTMAEAYGLSFTGGLGEVGAQIHLPEELTKMAEGKKLIQKFCKPNPKNYKVRRYDRHTHPEDWETFKQYCIRDTTAERAMHRVGFVAP
jgi:DNA polymerase